MLDLEGDDIHAGMSSETKEHDPWRTASWQGAAEASLIEGSRLSMGQKLAWLEEVGRLAANLSPRKAGHDSKSDPRPPAS